LSIPWPGARIAVRRDAAVPQWEYHVETINISDRWSAKRQREEVERFKGYLNQMGQSGWELVSYESVPLTGHFSGTIKGYAYLTFFKRPRP
jgi:hypothetical protein